MFYAKILLLALYVDEVCSLFSCKDQNNEDVDWYVALKMPKAAGASLVDGSDGYGFFYLDYKNKRFAASSVSLKNRTQAIGYTLQQVYDHLNDTDVFYTMYNDEVGKPVNVLDEIKSKFFDLLGTKSVQYGHMKGVLLFDKTQGFWLVHSVPAFPPINKYEYIQSGTVYGQHFLCMTFQYNQLEKIGTQLYYNHPKTYLSSIPTDIASENPDLASAVAHKYHTGPSTSRVVDLVTAKGITFKSFAKTHEFADDLYEKLVAPTLKAGLNVETWKRGSQIPLHCPPPTYPVYDVQNLKVLTSSQYSYTYDHSKYAISRENSRPYVCHGDINRMTSQYVRGGGTICLKDEFVWSEYVGFFLSETAC